MSKFYPIATDIDEGRKPLRFFATGKVVKGNKTLENCVLSETISKQSQSSSPTNMFTVMNETGNSSKCSSVQTSNCARFHRSKQTVMYLHSIHHVISINKNNNTWSHNFSDASPTKIRTMLFLWMWFLSFLVSPVLAINCNSCSECGSATQIAVTAENLPDGAFSGCTHITNEGNFVQFCDDYRQLCLRRLYLPHIYGWPGRFANHRCISFRRLHVHDGD